jgi:tetratricopeptide (TPR) repeat protein
VEQKPAEFQPRFHLAEAQFATAAYGDAEVAYRAALERDPKVPEAELGLARTLVRQNRLTEAEPHYRRAAELDPGCRDELLVLAESYENSGETAKAMAIYREFPENAAVQAHVGEMMLDTREYEEAIPRLEQAFRKDATQANRTALAFAYRAGRKLDKALPLLAAAVAAEPADYDIRMMYARTLRDLRQFQAAGDQFLAALKLKPGEARTWTDYAGMRYMIGDYTEALKAYRTATDAGDQSAGIWFYSAIMLDKMKQLQPAMEAYRRFLSLSNGKSPNQEFQARTRAGIIQKELDRK